MSGKREVQVALVSMFTRGLPPTVRIDGEDHTIEFHEDGTVGYAGRVVGSVAHRTDGGVLKSDAVRPDGSVAGSYRDGKRAAVALIRDWVNS